MYDTYVTTIETAIITHRMIKILKIGSKILPARLKISSNSRSLHELYMLKPWVKILAREGRILTAHSVRQSVSGIRI